MRASALPVIAALLCLTGCGGASSGSEPMSPSVASTATSAGPTSEAADAGTATSTTATSTTATGPTTTSPAPTSAADASRYPCLSAADRGRLVHLGDGPTAFDAVVLGDGPVGVVLGHQYEADLCQTYAYATTLAQAGYRVAAVSYGQWDPGTVTTAAAHLRAAGARGIVLMGASLGGTMELAAASSVPGLRAVVCLSAPARYLDTDAVAGIGTITAPIFLGVGGGDGEYATAATTLKGAAKASSHVELVAPAGDTRHGVDLLQGAPTVTGPLMTFLGRYAPPR